MKTISILSEMSYWHWEISSFKHASELFESRLDSLTAASLPPEKKRSLEGVLREVQTHRRELSKIHKDIQDYSHSFSLRNRAHDEEDSVHSNLRTRITQEINSFGTVKNKFSEFIRDVLFSVN